MSEDDHDVNDLLLTHLVLNVDDVEFEPWPIPRGENGITIHGNPGVRRQVPPSFRGRPHT